TGLVLSSATVVYGHEDTVVFTAATTPQFSGTPTGTVAVAAGATALCTLTLSGGSGTCGIGATLLPASATPYSVVGTYGGDANFTGSVSAPQSLTVQQASTTTALTVTPSSVAYGNEQMVSFAVTVTPQFAGVPTGSVTVTAGSTPLCTV